MGTPFDVQHIFPFVLNRNAEIATQAAKTVKLLMSTTKPHEWKKLYDSFRYINLDLSRLSLLKKLPADCQVHLMGVASLNGNGYVREKALSNIEQLNDVEGLPYVVLRLSDWVQTICNLTCQIFRSLLKTIPIEGVIKHHSLIMALKRIERVDLTGILDEVMEWLGSPERRSELLALFPTVSVKDRLFCLNSLEKKLVNEPELLEMLLNDDSLEVRAWIARRLPLGDELNQRLHLLLRDRTARVRLAALDRLPDDSYEDLQETLLGLIFDRSPSVRETARYVLKRHATDDFRRLYLERIMDSALVEPGVVAGLAETGEAEDFDIVSRFLSDSRSKLRAEAISGMGKLNPEATADFAIERLDDSSGKVRRAAMKCLVNLKDPTKRRMLRQVLQHGSLPGGVCALRVLAGSGELEALEDILLALLSKTHEALVAAAWQQLERWHRKHSVRAWFQKPKNIVNRIEELLAKHRELHTQPPEFARSAWEDLPHLVGVSG